MSDRRARWTGRLGLSVAAIGWCLAGPCAAQGASIDVGSASGPPGAEVVVAVTLRTMGAAVVAAQNRIDFPRATAVAAAGTGQPDCQVNPDIAKEATGFRFLPLGCNPAADCEAVRAFVLSFSNVDPIADGSVLYTCRIAIAGDAEPGVYPLVNAEVGASAAGGQSVPATGTNGVVEVEAPPLDPVASVRVGSASGVPAQTVSVGVTLALLDPQAEVAGVQHDIEFDAVTPIADGAGGRPDCTVDPEIEKEASAFVFLPDGCTPAVDCEGARAFILSASNLDPIADGATLYTCRVAIAPVALPGRHALRNTNALASGSAGQPLAAEAQDGAIEVLLEPAPCPGDCDGDQTVAINELLLGVNLAIGGAPVSQCPAFDVDRDGQVTINEVVLAVNNALAGCTG